MARTTKQTTPKLTEEQAQAEAMRMIAAAILSAQSGDRTDQVALIEAGSRRKAAIGAAIYSGYIVKVGAQGNKPVAVNHADAWTSIRTAMGWKAVGAAIDFGAGIKPRSVGTLWEDFTFHALSAHITEAVRVVDEVGKPVDTKHVKQALALFGKGNKAEAVKVAMSAESVSEGSTSKKITAHVVAERMGAAIVAGSTLDAVLNPVDAADADAVKVVKRAHKGIGSGLLALIEEEDFRGAIAAASVDELRLLARLIDGAIKARDKVPAPVAPAVVAEQIAVTEASAPAPIAPVVPIAPAPDVAAVVAAVMAAMAAQTAVAAG